MALQVWLPLNGNLNNQGLTNWQFTNNNATVDNSGKIGKCYAFSGSSQYLRLNQKVIDTSQFTISFWMYATNVSANHCIFSTRNVTSGAVNIYLLSAGIRFDTSTTANWQTSFKPSANTWYHITLVQDATTKYLYVNGVLNNSTAGTTDLTQVSSVCTIGCEHINGSSIGTYFAGKLNDFRIYDHALAPKEIEILSRGLVCHYPLNNNGGGQPNLYDFESVANKWKVTKDEELTLVDATDDVYGNVLKITTPSSVNSARIYRGVKNIWEADTNFTVSFLAKASKTAVMKIERSRTDYAPDVTVGTTWKRYSTVIPCSATTTGGALGIQTSTASADIYLTQIKLELGDKATAYCPGAGDSHYIPLGYDSTTEYDVSGNGYNGTKNNITYDSNTARYSTSSVFDNTQSGRIFTPNFNIGNEWSFGVWVKPPTTARGWESVAILNSTSGDGDTQLGLYIYKNSNYVEFVCNTQTALITSYAFDGNWHHIFGTFDGTTFKGYIDGELKVTKEITHALLSRTNLGIGGRHSTSDTSFADYYLGNMSDFRIYATALSAAQIAELYNTAVSVANNGTLMGYELVEV